MTRPLERGFTLIEMIVFLVVVAVAMAALLQLMAVAVKFSALPLQRKQALSLAEGLLQEMSQRDYLEIQTPALATLVNGLQASLVVSEAYALSSASSNIKTKKITVNVRFADQSLSLSGYRSDYAIAAPVP